MGLFNTLADAVPEVCPHCGSQIRRSVQFTYGLTRQLTYHLGEKLAWADLGNMNNRGFPGYAAVVAEGYPELCPVCGYDLPGDVRYDVLIEDDVLVGARPLSGEYRFGPEGFVVVQD